MDTSSQEKIIQNGKNSATGKAVSEVNETTTFMRKNHENMEDFKSFGVLNGSPGHKPEHLTRKTKSPRKIISEHEHVMEEIQPMVCDPGLQKLRHLPDDASKYSISEQSNATPKAETKKLSQPGNCKKGGPGKREKLFIGSPRVLRSRSQEKSKTPESVNAPAQHAESKEKKRRKKQIKKNNMDAFSKIKTHLRYLLSRMNYEKSFIDAYAGEGWRGQSLEKLKPEKELDRAKSYIFRYKLKIRDLFQHIDTSCGEGRIPESLFDSEGLIDSEDIFCAKCGQTDVRLDNDIILCDGACERGFHQFCLEPPLLKEQVPPGDEGWLCPACDCKVDCIDLINDSQGTNLSISDSWEKVFPEAAASGNKQDVLGLPSDDSEDDDFNPDGPEVNEEVDGEESSSDESDFSSASEDLGAVANNEQDLGLPSEDSEDDDYNPDGVGSDEQVKSESSSADFTSDSEDFIDEGSLAEVQRPSMSENSEGMPKTGIEDDRSTPITAKRNVERLDYKKLHDETYGNVTSDSSDEDFYDTESPKRKKKTKGVEDTAFKQKHKESETTPIERTGKKLDIEGISDSTEHKDSPPLGSGDKSNTKSSSRRFDEAVAQRLDESFKDNPHPDRNTRENLARELKLTVDQITKWFGRTRRKNTEAGKSLNAATKREQGESTPIRSTSKKLNVERTSSSARKDSLALNSGTGSSTKSTFRPFGEAAAQRLSESFKENHYPDRNAKETLAKELKLTLNQVSRWFINARWSFKHPGGRTKANKSLPKSQNVVPKNQPNEANKEKPKSPQTKKRKAKTVSPNQSVRRSGRLRSKTPTS